MSTGPRIPYRDAITAASLFIANIAHCCERIEIAGSLRRHACNPHRPADATVGDVELVAIPRMNGKTNELWQRIELLKYRLWEGRYATSGKTYHRAGPLFRKYWIPGIPPALVPVGKGRYRQLPTPQYACELYLATRTNYGYISVLRTGPDDFNRRMVLDKARGGFKPDDLTFRDGKVWLTTPAGLVEWQVYHEFDLFRALEIPFIPPHLRSGDVVQGIHRAEVAA